MSFLRKRSTKGIGRVLCVDRDKPQDRSDQHMRGGTGTGLAVLFLILLLACLYRLKRKPGEARERQWCPECKKHVLAVRPKTDSTPNVLLSVLTMGLWLLVWACTADLSTKRPYQCPTCGTRTQKMADSDAVERI